MVVAIVVVVVVKVVVAVVPIAVVTVTIVVIVVVIVEDMAAVVTELVSSIRRRKTRSGEGKRTSVKMMGRKGTQ